MTVNIRKKKYAKPQFCATSSNEFFFYVYFLNKLWVSLRDKASCSSRLMRETCIFHFQMRRVLLMTEKCFNFFFLISFCSIQLKPWNCGAPEMSLSLLNNFQIWILKAVPHLEVQRQMQLSSVNVNETLELWWSWLCNYHSTVNHHHPVSYCQSVNHTIAVWSTPCLNEEKNAQFYNAI